MVHDIANLAVGQEQGANWFGVSYRVDLAFFQRQSKLPCWEYTPGHIPARVHTVSSQNSIGKDERRGSHPRYTNSFSAQVLRRLDVAIDG